MTGAILSGTVVASDGSTPVAGAEVALEQGNTVLVTTETDSAGAYELEGVVAGTYSVVEGGSTGTTAPLTVSVGSANVAVAPLQEGAAVLSGAVVDPANNPISEANVLLVSGSLPDAVLALTTTTDTNGNFTFANLAPGAYSLFIETTGFPAQLEQVTVSTNPAPLTVHLSAGTTLSGAITDLAPGWRSQTRPST